MKTYVLLLNQFAEVLLKNQATGV